jgi:mannosyl-oligosaccharide alpha-1,2-mannosidase
MYMKSVDAIRKHMLYRPMTKDGRDILFSGSVTTFGNPEVDLQLSADVEHLTCFIGGMIGMSAKIFGIEGDLEIAKKLADGCVWAYESFPLGIMPEGATVMPCKNSEMCPWNETAYFEFLDPIPPATRENQIADYFARKALQEQEAAAELARAVEVAAEEAKKQALDAEALKTGTEPGHAEGRDDAPEPAHDYDTTDPSKGSDSLKREKPTSLQKRQDDPKKDLPKPVTHNFQDDVPSKTIPEKSPVGLSEVKLSPEEMLLRQKSEEHETELESISKSGRPPHQPPVKAPAPAMLADPWKPATHEEFVQAKIKEQSLPPGFASIKSRKYILR